MDEQITQLDKRLTVVEKNVSMLTAQTEKEHLHYATKEDVAAVRIEIVESELKLTTQIATVDSKLSAQIAALDSKLSAHIAALESKIFQMELRYVRWTVGTVITVAGIVLAIVRTFP
jgi:hypothetical protein